MRAPALAVILALVASATAAQELSVFSLAGSIGGRGLADGPALSARFQSPRGIAAAPDGTLFVADPHVRRIARDGNVSSIAGPFDFPDGIAVARDGSVYFTNQLEATVHRIDANGRSTIVAGPAGLQRPTGIAIDDAGESFVADAYADRILRIVDGRVTTFFGDPTAGGETLSRPFALAFAADGSLYVGELSGRIRRIARSGLSTLIAQGFAEPTGLAVAADGTLFVAERIGRRIWAIDPITREIRLVARIDGEPIGVAIGSGGALFVSDALGAVLRIEAGVATTFAGSAPERGFVDARGALARFDEPSDVAVDARGNVFVADTRNGAVRKIAADGTVTTVARGLTTPRSIAVDAAGGLFISEARGVRQLALEGVGAQAVVAADVIDAGGIAVDRSGNLYIADWRAGRLVRVRANGEMSNVAAGVVQPYDVAIDDTGNLWIADLGDDTVKRLTADGLVTTYRGFAGPASITIDARGNAWVAEIGGRSISRIDAQSGAVTRAIANARFEWPVGIATDANGNLYIADAVAGAIRVAGLNGDANGDFAVDLLDLEQLRSGGRVTRYADVNRDGVVDERDLSELSRMLNVRRRPGRR